jgi:UDPglucose 6-dehydrogenase
LNREHKTEKVKVAIIGTGYVGLTAGVCLGFLGHKVTCLDSDEAKIDTLRSGRAPIYEPGLEELLVPARAEVVFIAVGTPPLPTGGPDLSYLRSASQSVAKYLDGPFTVVVNKSSTTGRSRPAVSPLHRIPDSLYPDRVVIGTDEPAPLRFSSLSTAPCWIRPLPRPLSCRARRISAPYP